MTAAATAERQRTSEGTFARPSAPRGYRNFARDLVEKLRGLDVTTWPDTKWKDDPVGFVEEVLHDRPWGKQIEFLESVRDNSHVAFRSAHKIGKSRCLVWLALWWYCTREDARVLFTSSAERQVDEVLWRELVLVIRRSGIQLTERPAEHAKTGLKSYDKREIVGMSAREAEAVAGISGAEVLYLVDEASGCSESLFAAFEGNIAGGGKIVLTSNPTRCFGQFYDAFQPSSSDVWKTIHASALDSPNVIAGKILIKGLATAEYVEGRKAAWGEDSSDYKVRVLGEFPTNEERRMLTIHEIEEALKRWTDTPARGPLRVGVDIAGAGVGGDETAIVPRRGLKVPQIYRYRSATSADILANLRAICREHRGDDPNVPIVVIDCEGFGWATFEHIAGWAVDSEENKREMVVVGVHSSHRAQRDPGRFERVRDELFFVAEEWIKSGGAIPDDLKLTQELHAPEWIGQPNGRLKATPKDELRKILGRSPDSFDALALSCWEVDNLAERVAEQTKLNDLERRQAAQRRVPRLDPYSAEDAWRRR